MMEARLYGNGGRGGVLADKRGAGAAAQLARQILLLLDGSFAVVLLHRDPSYMETAGEAAHTLISAALAPRRSRR